MKKLHLLSILFALLLAACTNSDDDNSPNNPNSNSNGPNNGSWKVTYFWDKDKEETSKFNGHSFEFQSNGSLVATANGSTYTGTWSKNSSGTRFNISISGTEGLDEMTDDWLLDEMTSNSIKLRDDNTEHLEELYLELQ